VGGSETCTADEWGGGRINWSKKSARILTRIITVIIIIIIIIIIIVYRWKRGSATRGQSIGDLLYTRYICRFLIIGVGHCLRGGEREREMTRPGRDSAVTDRAR
jgi:hypothetical protein